MKKIINTKYEFTFIEIKDIIIKYLESINEIIDFEKEKLYINFKREYFDETSPQQIATHISIIQNIN